jgi:Bacterial mobilisation protein (MobC).
MSIRKRTHDLHVYLDDQEYALLQTLCDKMKRNQSFVIRCLIAMAELIEAPPADFKAFTVELRRIGTNLNQLVAKANSVNFVDRAECEAVLADYRKLERQIASYFKPRKRKRLWQ